MEHPGQNAVWPASQTSCGEHIRSHPWSEHPLGPLAQWPQSLKYVVGSILDCSYALVALWGPGLHQIYNDAYARILGTRHPLGMGQKTAECWPELWDFSQPVYKQVLAGETVDYDAHLLRMLRGKEFENRYFDLCYSPLRNDSQAIEGVLVTVCDVTDRVRVEAELRLNNKRLSALVSAISYSTYSMAPDWSEMLEMKGGGFLADTSEATQQWLGMYIHPDDQKTVLAAIADAVASGKKFELEHRVRRADGTLGWTLSRAVPVRNDQGEIDEWFGAASDLTAKKLSERALLESEKLAVVGRLASSIAHEINNPLESVTNLLYLAKASCRDETTSDYLAKADGELRRVSHIVAATLRFHRQSTHQTRAAVIELLDSVLTLHQGSITAIGVTTQIHCSPNLHMKCWPNEVRQVLANLVSNAIDAMKTAPFRRLLIRAKATRSGTSILVCDTGSGISKTSRQRIFDPFFTTKHSTGNGLGLWVSRDIMTRHKGRIRVRSVQSGPHAGTAFALFFPES